MFDITGCKFEYKSLRRDIWLATITTPNNQRFSLDFNQHPNFRANEDTDKQIFAEFIKNGRNFIIEVEAEILNENPPEPIAQTEIKINNPLEVKPEGTQIN